MAVQDQGCLSQKSSADAGGTFPRQGVSLLWALCLLPLLLFGAFAVYQREETLREGEMAVGRTIQILEEHALRVFEAQQLIIEQTDQYLGEMTWDEIRASEDVHRFLRRAAAVSPHVDGLWLVPPDGRTANSADFFPFPDISVADRTYFRTLRERNELHYGEMIVGRTKGTFNFNLSRRRSPRDSFNGVILVTSSLAYFTEFWQQASKGPFVAGLFREDGEILARFPMLEPIPQSLSEASSMLEQMQESDDSVYQSTSSLDGQARIYGYSRIGNTPLFIGYGVPNTEILSSWRNEMLRMGLVALMASALLAVATATIMRQNRRLGATATTWRHTAEELQQEVQRRLRAEDVAEERRRLLDEVRALTAQRQSVLENIAEGVIALDADGSVIYANREAAKILGPLREGGQLFSSLIEAGRITSPDGTRLDPSLSPERDPLGGKDLPEREYLVRAEDGSRVACLFRGGAIVGEEGRAEGAVLTFWDISERKREAERRELLMRELDHRVRNMLATIMAMIRISNEPGQSKEAYVAALSGRVAAMARTHGMLSEGAWNGATIGRLVDDEVASAADTRQLVLNGDRNVMLPPKEAADLALALHELATNATKHGAWSVPEGSLVLQWDREDSDHGEVLRVQWKESGGPEIDRPPDRAGFGSILLRGIFAGEDGVSIDYEPDGLRCTMLVPIQGARWRGGAEQAPSDDATPAPGETCLNGIRVLVVEDEAVVRMDMLQMLRDAGASIIAEAGSLEEGLDKASSATVDAAVLDKNLNGKSSLPIAQLLADRGVAIVFVSGYRSVDGAEEAEYAHLQKPVTEQALLSALKLAVTSQSGRRH